MNKKVELGHLLLITTDQYQFIADYKVMEGEKDPSQIPSLIQRIQQKFKEQKIYSHSLIKAYIVMTTSPPCSNQAYKK
jgi:IS5 family transposase